jgi:hypothetical protein
VKNLVPFRKQAVHNRTISISTYRAGEDSIMVEGILKDTRHCSIYSVTTGEQHPPGTVHEMALRLLLGADLEVLDLEVDMPHMPRNECYETARSLEPLRGRRISSGFTSWVKKTFGGPNGCTHLNALLLATAPAAVQGLYSAVMMQPRTAGEASLILDSGYLVDSCRIWRSDGPLVKEFRSAIKQRT